MTVQLVLIDDNPSDWRIPESTKHLGRRGIAEARAILHQIPRRAEVAETSSAVPAASAGQIAA